MEYVNKEAASVFFLLFLFSLIVSLAPNSITVKEEQACVMSICESHGSVAGRSEGDLEQIPEIALKRLERASTINTNTPTSVSLWDLSKPSEGEKQRITREKFNKPFRERVIGADDRCKVARKDLGPRGRYRCKKVVFS